MYIGMLIVLMLIFPVASIALEVFVHNHGVLDVAIVGKWFVFWAVGMRLLIAGLRQIVQPRYTAETILGVKDPGAMLIVRELGFANTSIGSAGLLQRLRIVKMWAKLARTRSSLNSLLDDAHISDGL